MSERAQRGTEPFAFDRSHVVPMAAARSGPLADLRIVDLTQALAGPFCTMLLADLGADVIKVEPPGGDMARLQTPHPPDPQGCDYGGYFASVNRNKRSVVLDLKQDGDRETVLHLAEASDVVVENYRPGVMDRLGVGYETLRERNPRLVYAAIRGFGDPRTGASPYRDRPMFDVVAQSLGGVVGMTGEPGTQGTRCGASVGDLFPGTLCALGIVSAVHEARRSGMGQFLDVAMYDGVLALCENLVYRYSWGGEVLEPRGSGHPALCPFDVLATRDGACAVAAPRDYQWRDLCAAMGRAELGEDPRAATNNARRENREWVLAQVAAWARERTTGELVAALEGKVPVGPVQRAPDVFADHHVGVREMLVEVPLPGDNPRGVLAGAPIKMTRTRPGIYRRAPTLGEHTAEVLEELGIAHATGRSEP